MTAICRSAGSPVAGWVVGQPRCRCPNTLAPAYRAVAQVHARFTFAPDTFAMRPSSRPHFMPGRRQLLCAAAALAVASPSRAQSLPVQDELWTDGVRGRSLPVRIRWPTTPLGEAAADTPVVLFSHGLGGTRAGGAVWGEAWAAAGFAVLHLQHPGSDFEAVRAGAGSFSNRAGLAAVAGPEQLLARLLDVRFAVDEIGRRQAAGQARWVGARMDRLGLCGHSFGAHTTLGAAGQRYPGFEGISEPRLASFIAFSPTVPAIGNAQQAFGRLSRPVLTLTGTRDEDVLGNGATPDKRIAVFAALPPGGKAQLVLQDADHMTFGGQTGRAAEIVPRESVTRDQQARDHALVAAITTDWWRATLLDDADARARLIAPAGLRPGDRWQQK